MKFLILGGNELNSFGPGYLQCFLLSYLRQLKLLVVVFYNVFLVFQVYRDIISDCRLVTLLYLT